MPGDIRPEGLQVTSGPSDRGDLHDQAKGKSQEYCADFTSRFLANTPCSRPMPRAMCSVTNSSSTPTTLKTGNSHEIGRASCRERVCQYVYISGVAVSYKQNKLQNYTITKSHVKLT